MEPLKALLVCTAVLTAVFFAPANLAPTHSGAVERRSAAADSELVQQLEVIVGQLTETQERQIEDLVERYGCHLGGCSSTELAKVCFLSYYRMYLIMPYFSNSTCVVHDSTQSIPPA